MKGCFGFDSVSVLPIVVQNVGLYSQTASSVPVTDTIAETTLIDGGVGTLTVPANGFSIGDSFKVNMLGHISCQNNRTIRIRVKANSTVLGDTGIITLPQITNKHFSLDINFTIRGLGFPTFASVVTGAVFTYSKNASNNFEGGDFVTINNTTFDTTIANTLDITAQWGNASIQNSIYTDIFNIYKIY
jgi:hypothetical protein